MHDSFLSLDTEEVYYVKTTKIHIYIYFVGGATHFRVVMNDSFLSLEEVSSVQ